MFSTQAKQADAPAPAGEASAVTPKKFNIVLPLDITGSIQVGGTSSIISLKDYR